MGCCPCWRHRGSRQRDAPDFESKEYWLAHPRHHPGRVRASLPQLCRTFDGEEAGVENAVVEPVSYDDDQESAPADAFFLHGTMEGWGNRASVGRYDREVWRGFNTHHQMTMVTAFTVACRAYAPLYRQAGGMGGDWNLAYEDCLAAFEQFLAEVGPRRPLVLAGHSQGAMHVARLLRERVAPDAELMSRVVGVYAPGMAWRDGPGAAPLPVEGASGAEFGAGDPTIAVWATVTPGARRQEVLVGMMSRGLEAPPPSANPGAWMPGGHFPGALLPDEEEQPRLYRGLASRTGVSDQGLLELHPGAGAGAGEVLRKLNWGGKDFHAYDIHLFWGNVRFRVQKQVEAYLSKSRASAS